MRQFGRNARARLLAGVSAGIILSGACAAHAEERAAINIAPQPLASALYQFGGQTGLQVMFAPSLAAKKQSPGVNGDTDVRLAMAHLLDGTGLTFRREGDIFVIMDANDPQSAGAAGDGADGTVAALVVTAQKRQENIQDVPIAISAFTEKTLQEQKIEGGFDLLKAIPNVTFSKNNFTGYNFSIRGIGTKAVSATTDPGVAVSFNNASLIQNRLFEQEYFDVERVEVLRGPQGTLYGRNATAGVINVISAKPNLHEFGAWAKGEVGNYNARRVSGMINVPLVSDKLALRLAGALTKRDGYDYNATTKDHVNGRDLWSTRLTIGFNPTENIRTNLVWERFHEDDNRSRTGKQLCKRDPGIDTVGSTPLGYGPKSRVLLAGMETSQGCLPVSLYDKDAYETPNGLAIPFVAWIVFNDQYAHDDDPSITVFSYPIGLDPSVQEGYSGVHLLRAADPYGGRRQVRDLRVINSIRDPKYRANADIIQLSIDLDLTKDLTLSAQTTYDRDSVYSFQDYNRFTTDPVIIDTLPLLDPYDWSGNPGPSPWANLAPHGYYCDPQIGCSNTLAGFDLSQAKSVEWTHELRLQSNFDGPLNFSAGANYTTFKVLADYYVFFNLISAVAQTPLFNFQGDMTLCDVPVVNFFPNPTDVVENGSPESNCPYIDPNPIESINGEGHNYFRSKNPYKLSSLASFGEIYYHVSPALKLTAGLRYTDDRKSFTLVPSQLLLSTSLIGSGDVSRGYPALAELKQHWGEFTGRVGLDWKPEFSFTDQTMVYAFYSRGYKGGGANPPPVGFSKRTIREVTGNSFFPEVPFNYPLRQVPSDTFKPEFVNAFEVGAKNTLFGGALTFNSDAFFYDYKDYQVSKVVDRTVANENFDSKVWGLEFETVFAPSRRVQVIGNLGYLDTSIGSGARSIDVMNRTQGHAGWMVLKPWLQQPSNCIVPVWVAEPFVVVTHFASSGLCGGAGLGDIFRLHFPDSVKGGYYDPANYPEINGGAGFYQDLKGNELPNSPHWTANIGAQYGTEFGAWRATVRGDAYWQSQSWARVYNAVNDKLHGWYNANLSLWLENDDGVKIEIYAKNILDKSPITDSFINSDDTALTTNVFTLDPRLIGLSVKKEF